LERFQVEQSITSLGGVEAFNDIHE